MLIQKNDKLYLALVVCFGLLEALFIILQMHKISMIANAIFMQNIAVVMLHTDFVQLMLYMIAVV
jgi:hypothetical protein